MIGAMEIGVKRIGINEPPFKYHYGLIDFEVQLHSGALSPSSDVLEVKWFNVNELKKRDLPEITRKFLKKHYHLDEIVFNPY